MPTDPFAAIMEGERRALIAEQVASDKPSFAAVADIATVRDLPTRLRGQHPVNLESVGTDSFVQVCPTLGYRFLWTHISNGDYRAEYARFIERTYPLTAGQGLPPSLHVDHLYNRARARVFGLNYVRMVLLPGSINMSHGASYEKKRTRGIGGHGRDRSVDTVMLMKLFGFLSPAEVGPRATDVRHFAALLAPMLRTTPAELVAEVNDLLDVAAFRPG